MGGTHPIIGATVSLWSAGTTAAQVGTSVTTNASGQFSMSFDCVTPGALMYVTATSGHIGSGAANAHIRLVSAIGACSGMPASIVVNELTSTAAAYALSGFAPAAGTTAVSFQGKSPGINQAFLTLTNLIVPATGAIATAGREINLAVIRQRLDTVANALAACDVTSVAGACAELFSCARANATFVATGQACTTGTSTTTTDTMNAALSIVQNAGLVSAAGIFDVASTSASFAPALGAAPAEWSLPLVFNVRNYGPLAIDAGGHVWFLAPDPNPAPSTANLAVTEMNADGTFLSPHQTGHDWSTGGVSSITGVTNLAIDQSGNVWVSGTGHTIAELNSSGLGVAGSPYNAGAGPNDTAAVAIDSAGNAWFASGDVQPSVFEISGGNGTAVGTNLSTASGYSTTNCPCNGMSADALGNVWTVSNGMNQFLAQIDAAGNESNILTPPAVSGNFGLSTFLAIATDGSGNLWITDQHYHGVWQFTPSGSAGTYSAAPFSNAAGPGTAPKAIAIDGASHKWIANNPLSTYPSITELSADGATNLSPIDGFGFQVNSGTVSAPGVVTNAYGIAVDGSGNVWVSDGNVNLTEYVGAAAPTKNPVAAAVTSGSFVP
jgi:hypothetical protein